jgi:hypothetical protein
MSPVMDRTERHYIVTNHYVLSAAVRESDP